MSPPRGRKLGAEEITSSLVGGILPLLFEEHRRSQCGRGGVRQGEEEKLRSESPQKG